MAQGGGSGDSGGVKYAVGKANVAGWQNSPLMKSRRAAEAMKRAQSLLGGAGGQRTRKRGILIGDPMIPSLLLGG